MKRKDYISYDDMFISIAAITSYRSKDPRTQNGCVIVNPRNRIVSVGYNGFPDNCSDDEFPWSSPEKYSYVEHAERNAIYSAGRMGIPLDNCTMYLYSERGYYPCSDCARAISLSGITQIKLAYIAPGNISENGQYLWEPTKRMFKAKGIKISIIKLVNNSFLNVATKLQKSSNIISNQNRK